MEKNNSEFIGLISIFLISWFFAAPAKAEVDFYDTGKLSRFCAPYYQPGGDDLPDTGSTPNLDRRDFCEGYLHGVIDTALAQGPLLLAKGQCFAPNEFLFVGAAETTYKKFLANPQNVMRYNHVGPIQTVLVALIEAYPCTAAVWVDPDAPKVEGQCIGPDCAMPCNKEKCQ